MKVINTKITGICYAGYRRMDAGLRFFEKIKIMLATITEISANN
jgi:hypothetical protein